MGDCLCLRDLGHNFIIVENLIVRKKWFTIKFSFFLLLSWCEVLYPDFEVFASDNKLVEAVFATAGQVFIKMDMFQWFRLVSKKDWNEQIIRYTPVVGQHKGGYVVTCHRPEGIIS